VTQRRRILGILRYIAERYLEHDADGSAKRLEAAQMLKDFADRYSPFAGMVRAELANMGIDWQDL
jgi:hypothetical protein